MTDDNMPSDSAPLHDGSMGGSESARAAGTSSAGMHPGGSLVPSGATHYPKATATHEQLCADSKLFFPTLMNLLNYLGLPLKVGARALASGLLSPFALQSWRQQHHAASSLQGTLPDLSPDASLCLKAIGNVRAVVHVHTVVRRTAACAQVPKIGGQEVDLHRLYKEVTKMHGLERVMVNKLFVQVCEPFNFPASFTNKSFVMRKLYCNVLHHFEQVSVPLGTSITCCAVRRATQAPPRRLPTSLHKLPAAPHARARACAALLPQNGVLPAGAAARQRAPPGEQPQQQQQHGHEPT